MAFGTQLESSHRHPVYGCVKDFILGLRLPKVVIFFLDVTYALNPEALKADSHSFLVGYRSNARDISRLGAQHRSKSAL
jgi:hypothetical protein